MAKHKLTIKRIRAAGVLNKCPRGCEPDIEKDGGMALFCVPCGWRYELTPAENRRARRILGMKNPGGRPSEPKADTDERGERIARMYKLGVQVQIISASEDVSTQAVYEALKRHGVPRRGLIHVMQIFARRKHRARVLHAPGKVADDGL